MTKEEYKNYLASEDLRNKKTLKENRTPKRCAICAATTNIHLHHLYYRFEPKYSQMYDLRWLCALCHKTTHDLIKAGTLTFPKPSNHNSCFTLTKTAVKKQLGYSPLNMFREQLT